jgi:hypothetical protein
MIDLMPIPASVFPGCQLERCFMLRNHAAYTSVSSHFLDNFNKTRPNDSYLIWTPYVIRATPNRITIYTNNKRGHNKSLDELS